MCAHTCVRLAYEVIMSLSVLHCNVRELSSLESVALNFARTRQDKMEQKKKEMNWVPLFIIAVKNARENSVTLRVTCFDRLSDILNIALRLNDSEITMDGAKI